MKKILVFSLAITIIFTCVLGCSKSDKPDAGNPVTLNIWHVYGSQTQSPLNNLIDEFNGTVGKENGITINVVSVTSSSAIDKALSASTNNEPGAEDMPDLFTAYPRVVEIVGKDNLLSWDNYFSDEELSQFTGEFLSEGYFDEKLLMLPIAKSSETLYVNQTLFDRFSNETDCTYEDLKSFEGLFETVRKYYDWSEGNNFMQFNDFYNYAYIGMKSQNAEFVTNGKLQLNSEQFKNIWYPLAETAIYGGICLEDGYAASRWKTVEIISNIGSTADVLYQPNKVIYSDNTSEPITSLALPYPTFRDDFFGTVSRGGGLFAVKNDDERKNYAAYIFAKWLTAKENNLKFVTQSGYMPVTKDAFNTLFSDINVVENNSYHSLYESINVMNKNYTFYSLPLYKGASDTQSKFEQNVKNVLSAAHNQYIKRTSNGEDAQTVLSELTADSLNELIYLSNN